MNTPAALKKERRNHNRNHRSKHPPLAPCFQICHDLAPVVYYKQLSDHVVEVVTLFIAFATQPPDKDQIPDNEEDVEDEEDMYDWFSYRQVMTGMMASAARA